MPPEISPRHAHAKRRPNLMRIALYLGILALLPIFMFMGYAIPGSGELTSPAAATQANIDIEAAAIPGSTSEPVESAVVTPESNVETILAPPDPGSTYLSISALPSIADQVEQVMPAVVSV